jgi:hypothetical protein
MNTPYTCVERSQEYQVRKSLAVLNRELTVKGLPERFSYEDSMLFLKAKTNDGNYFSLIPIKKYKQATIRANLRYTKKGNEHFITTILGTSKKRFYTVQFLLEVIDTIRVVKEITDDPDEYHYPIRLTYNDESCVISNQRQFRNFKRVKYDNLEFPLDAESIAKFKIESICQE